MAPATPARQRRRFGRINKLRSGRYQAGYIAPDGRVVYAEQTFPTKTAADRWLMLVESELSRDTWTPPERRRETVAEWSDRWLGSRTRLAERTVELYRWLLDRHILSVLGDIALGDLSGDDVLEWYQSLASTHRTTAAKAYRLLSSIMRAVVDDGVLARSPCRLAGAGREDAPTRPTATVVEVDRLATAMPEHMQIVVLLAAWCQLRRGEILGLQRLDVDLDYEVLTVERTRTPTMRSGVVVGGPKTEAGRRSVAIPPHVAVALAGHLERFVSPERTAWVIVGEHGGPLSAPHLQRAWDKARRSIGRPELHLHDLRHSGLTWAAQTGATTAELMLRAGHASPAAAMRYQHASRERDRTLAAALTDLATPR